MEFTSLQEPFDNSRFNFNRIGKEEVCACRYSRTQQPKLQFHFFDDSPSLVGGFGSQTPS